MTSTAHCLLQTASPGNDRYIGHFLESIHDQDRRSRLETCRAAAAQFLLSAVEGQHIIESQVVTIQSRWNDVCDEAGLSRVDRAFLWRRQFLNEYAFEGYEGGRLPEL